MGLKEFREAVAAVEAKLQAELDAESVAGVVVAKLPPAEAQEPNNSELEEAAVVEDVVEVKAASTEGDEADVVKETDAMVEEGTSEPIEEADAEQNGNEASKTESNVDADAALEQEEAPEREAAQENDDDDARDA